MAVYLIMPLDSTSSISKNLERRIIDAVPDPAHRFMLPGHNGCLVKYDGISLDLRKKMNLTGQDAEIDPSQSGNVISPDASPIPAVIFFIPTGAYNGYGPAELWEWLTNNTK